MSTECYRCNLVIPGAPKSGTTSLHAMLDAHSHIDMSRVKEPHHFAVDARFADGAAVHNALFAPSGRAAWYGEASTIYCISEKARKRIRECLNAPKFILLLREPMARLLSHYRWMTRLGHESRRLGEAIELDGFGFDPERHYDGNYRAYAQFSKYATYVPLWIQDFGVENVLILRSEALQVDQVGQLRRCAEFLGISEFRPIPQIEMNATDSVARQKLPSWMTGASRLLPAFLRKSRGFARLNALAMRLAPPAVPPIVTEVELAQLRQLLADDIAYYNAISDH